MKENIIIIIVAIVFVVVSFLIFTSEPKNNNINESLIENTINNVEKETEKINVQFDSSKVINAPDDYTYGPVIEENNITWGINVEIEDGKAYITTEFDKLDQYVRDIFGNAKEVEKQEITGFEGIPVQCVYATKGQDYTTPPLLIFIMEDGTVERVSSLNMLKNEEYVSEGKYSKLKDIVSFEYVNVSHNDGGGYATTVIIDKQNNSYDVFEIEE